MIDNWIPQQELWDESLETNLESEVKSRVIGVKHQIGTFDYYFRVSLGAQILRISDNLSKTLQDAHISASKRQAVSSLTVKILEKMMSDDHFNLFWETVTHKANALEVSEPSLPRVNNDLLVMNLEVLLLNLSTMLKIIFARFISVQLTLTQ